MLTRLAVVIAALPLFPGAIMADAATGTQEPATPVVQKATGSAAEALPRQLSEAEAKRLTALQQELAKERERYRELRRKGAAQAEVDAQWQKMERIRAQIRELCQPTCPYGGPIRLGPGGRQAGGAVGKGAGPHGKGMALRQGRRAGHGMRAMKHARASDCLGFGRRAQAGCCNRGRHGAMRWRCPNA